MRLNGLYTVCDLALRRVDDPVSNRYRAAFILGSLREDIVYLPWAGRVWEHLSLSHFYQPGLPGGFFPFWPGPRLKADRFFDRALRLFKDGRRAAGFVQLGRAAHLLIDMACPVHAQRTVHEEDPFEWCVEGHAPALRALPPAEPPAAARASELVEGLSRFTQRFTPDATNSAWGRFLERRGLRRPVGGREAFEQARELIPAAAAYTAALLALFLREARAGGPA
ncbi:MAG: hypothetical protein HY553_11765 [Elusimicrobia bacterium]|nr:hypothetical protein [Elusimicrobiota bacterium]